MNVSDRPDASLASRIAELPQGVEPQRDLWSGVEARIGVPGRSRWTELAVAAGVAALVSSVLFYALPQGGGQDEQADTQWASQQLDVAYGPLRAASLQRYRSQAERLDPVLRQSVETNLAIIDRALTEIRRTLATRPNDPALRQLLQWTYDQELAVVDAVTPTDAVTTDSPREPASGYRGAL